MNNDPRVSIECLSKSRELNVSFCNKVVTLDITQPIKTADGNKQKSMANVRLDSDSLIFLENEFLRCLPFSIQNSVQVDQVVSFGIPVPKFELDKWQSDSVSRSDKLSKRGMLCRFLQSFIESEENENIEILIDRFKDILSENSPHFRLLNQQLESASNQIQANISFEASNTNEYEKNNHFGTVSKVNVVDISSLVKDIGPESST